MKSYRCRFLGSVFLIVIISQSLLRLLLFIVSFSAFSHQILDFIRTFALGAVYDAVTGAFFCVPAAVLLGILPTGWLVKRRGRWPLLAVMLFMNFLLVFESVALFLFWQEFHTNFNFIAVDYLIYTNEMIGNICQAYPMGIILPALLAAAGALTWLQARYLHGPFQQKQWRKLAVQAAVAILLVVVSANVIDDDWREHVSTNQYNVELAGDGSYGFVHAFFANELDYHQFYVNEENGTALSDLRQQLQADNATFNEDDGIGRRVTNQNDLTGRHLNVVMITVESLSSSYSGAFGARTSWTPNLDALVAESYTFQRMYATGTRTVRGLEALSLSVPPTPGQSILRRPGNEDMATLGDAFRQNQYRTDFIYGGYGYFDNMNGFFEANGYTIKDRVSIPNEEIMQETVWGVADEVLFSQVLKSMDAHYASGDRAYEMVMTTSNHSPYTFPQGRVDAPQETREGAVRYTDWAIYDFLQRAKEKPWFKDTVFVIVADHQASAAGKTELPVDKYHIPCIIYAPGLIPAGRNDRLMSQMDLAPTLLGMLGLSYDSHFMGRDIAKVPVSEDRAFISTYQSMGYIKGNTLTVLDTGKKIRSYQIEDWEKSIYQPIDNDPAQVEEAMSWYQGASDLFHAGKLHQ